MSHLILTDLSTPTLARAIQENLFDFFRFMGRASVTEMEEGPGWLRWRTPIAHPWFNGLVCRRSPTEGDPDLVEQTLAYFRSHRTPTFTWWLGPGRHPDEWAPDLKAHGFRFESSTPGMALALDVLPAGERLPHGLKIAVVEDADRLRTWNEVFAAGYPIPEDMKDLFYDLLSGMGLELPIRNYLGILDGAPVAASSLFLGAGVAGVYCVATLPAARGQGVGAAMTLRPLYAARQLGYRAGILQSSEMGYPLYKQLGFQHLCTIDNFYWRG